MSDAVDGSLESEEFQFGSCKSIEFDLALFEAKLVKSEQLLNYCEFFFEGRELNPDSSQLLFEEFSFTSMLNPAH